MFSFFNLRYIVLCLPTSTTALLLLDSTTTCGCVCVKFNLLSLSLSIFCSISSFATGKLLYFTFTFAHDFFSVRFFYGGNSGVVLTNSGEGVVFCLFNDC